MRAQRKSRGTAPFILNLGTSWEWLTSGPYCSTPSPRPQSQPGCILEKPLAPASNQTPDHPSRSLVTTQIKLLQLCTYVFVFTCVCRGRGYINPHTKSFSNSLINTKVTGTNGISKLISYSPCRCVTLR
jgi:hypothetical protein